MKERRKILGYITNEKAPRLCDVCDKLGLPILSLKEISSGEFGNNIMFMKNSEIYYRAKEKRVFTKWFKPVYSIK